MIVHSNKLLAGHCGRQDGTGMSSSSVHIHASANLRAGTQFLCLQASPKRVPLRLRPFTVAARSRPVRSSFKVSASYQDNSFAAWNDGGSLHSSSAYVPYSAQLLLAVARLSHLERYREEIKALYEPGAPADLARCGLLISNIFSPQMDHRPYYQRLEDMVARALLLTLERFSSSSSSNTGSTGGIEGSRHNPDTANSTAGSSDDDLPGFNGLDPTNPQHLLHAIGAINQVLFDEEWLQDNKADPHDPLNGSLADVMDRRIGNQFSLAIIYLHVANGLGLPCRLVGSLEHILVRVGDPVSSRQRSSSTEHAAASFLVDVAIGGAVYSWQTRDSANSSSSAGSSVPTAFVPDDPMDTAGDINDEWHRALHDWLAQQQQQDLDNQQSSSSTAAASTGKKQKIARPFMASEEDLDKLSVAEGSIAGSDDDDSVQESGWREVDGYAAIDAASRNSWKALYGPGALTEWGGTVSSIGSSSSSSFSQQQGSWHDLDSNDGPGVDDFAAKSGYGILDSPFAALAELPFSPAESKVVEKGGPAEGGCEQQQHNQGDMVPLSEIAGGSLFGSSRLVSDSMQTWCESDTEADASSDPNTASIGSGASGLCSGTSTAGVLALTGDEVDVKYGGLQRVSPRVLLQQMLGAMKLSLTLSGWEEEALMVIRYLRATDPFSLPDLRDEALTLANMKQYDAAAALLREYLAVAPGAADADMVHEVLQQVLLAAQLRNNRQ